MPINFANFMLSLTAFIADRANLALGKDIWSLQADEKTAQDKNAAAYAVLVNYPGSPPEELIVVQRPAIQCMTTSTRVRDAQELASHIYAALYQQDPDGPQYGVRPIHDFVLPAKAMVNGEVAADPKNQKGYWVHQAIIMQSPGLVGVDAFQRHKVSFNFDIRFQIA